MTPTRSSRARLQAGSKQPHARRWPGFLAVFLLILQGQAAWSQTEYNRLPNPQTGGPTRDYAQVIVKFKQDAAMLRQHALSAHASAGEAASSAQARAQALGARVGFHMNAGRALSTHTQVFSATGMSSEALAARLAAEPDVEYAVVDHRVMPHAIPNDPLYGGGPPMVGRAGGPASGQWYLRSPAGDVLSSINAVNAWQLTTGSSSIVVAVLDTGVRPDHPDLASRLVSGYDMVSDPSYANDSGGRDADASDPGDWITITEDATRSGPFYTCGAANSSWHGTMTSSLIGAAANDGAGMAGVAWGIKLQPVRVLGKCGGDASDVIAGMLWAGGLPVPGVPNNPTPARVINLSLGQTGACSQSYIDAVNALSNKASPTIVVASAGNSSGHAVSTPANCPGIIAVGGLRHAGTKVGFSDLGPEITISAPAGNCVNTDSSLPCLYPILAASNTGTTVPAASTYTDAFNYSLGTSFSAPLVSGTVALMLSVRPSMSPAMVKAALQASARPFPTLGSLSASQTSATQACHAPDGSDQLECFCTTATCGAGMLDTGLAVANVLGIVSHDCLFNWAQTHYAGLFSPAANSQFYGQYYYRQYPANNTYLGVSSEDNHVYYMASGVMQDEGLASSWYTATGCK